MEDNYDESCIVIYLYTYTLFKKWAALSPVLRVFDLFKFAFICLVVTIGTTEVLGQETALEKKFQVLMNKGAYEKATELIPNILSGGTQHLDDYPDEYSALMNLIGVAYAEMHQDDKALTYYQLALTRAGQVKSDTSYEYGLYAYNLGMAYSGLGQYETADPYLLHALPILAKAYGAYSYEYTMMFYQLGLMYIEMGRYAEAEGMFKAVVYFFEQTSGVESEDYQNSLANLGRIYEGMGRYEEAEVLMLGVLEYYKGIGMSQASTISVGMNNLAQVYWKTARLADAERMYKESLELMHRAKIAEPMDSATLMNNLALVYKTASRFPEAEAAYKTAIAIYERLKMTEHPDYTNPINNLGELYRIMGRTEEAITAFVKVIEMREKLYGSEHVNYANSVNNLGLVYFGIGYYQESERMLLVSKEVYKKKLGTTHEYYANVLNNLAILYKAANLPVESEQHYIECLEVAKEALGANHPKYAMYLNGAGLLYATLDQYDKAIQMLEEAIAITESAYGELNYDYIDMIYNIAEVYREAGMKDKAKLRYLEAMDGYVSLIHQYFPFLNEEDKTAFYYTVSYRFDTYNSFVIEDILKNKGSADPVLIDKMFDLQLEIKSMLLNEVASIRERVKNTSSHELSEIFKQWEGTKKALIGAYSMSDDQRVLNEIDIAKLERAAGELEGQLSIGLYKFEMEAPSKPDSWKEVATWLHEDEALVEMIRVDYYDKVWTDKVYYVALIIHKNSTVPEVTIIEDGALLETDYYQHYRRSIWNQQVDNDSYYRFWRPIKEKLNDVAKLYFIPDGCYHKLNLYTLQNPDTKEFLIQESSIVLQSNSTDIIPPPERRKSGPGTIEIFAYPNYYLTRSEDEQAEELTLRSLERYGYSSLPSLPGTKTEAENISEIFVTGKLKTNTYLWDEATEENLKKIKSPLVLHIATHGYFLDAPVDYEEILEQRALNWSDRNPLFRSGIIMAGAGVEPGDTISISGEDGVLSAYEAMQMDLSNTELVVLSACETGLGELQNGQGVYGLQRAFLAAGAESLVMSLWQVEDNATQELMVNFYKRWQSESIGKQEAFRLSQLDVMKKYPNPVFWGAFVMLGK